MKYINHFNKCILEEFILFLHEMSHANNTVLSYKRDVQDFLSFLHVHLEKKIDSYSDFKYLKIHHFRSYITHCSYKKLGSRSIKRRISSIRSFFSFLERKKFIQCNAISAIKSPKIKKFTPAIHTIHEMKNILEYSRRTSCTLWIKRRNYAMVIFLYASGIRVSELLSLKDQKEMAETSLLVEGKGGKTRKVVILPPVAKSIQEYIIVRPFPYHKNMSLFRNKNGENLTSRGVQKVFNKISRFFPEKKKITPHTMRHTCATHLLNRGMSLNNIRITLGHSNLSTTKIYADKSIYEIAKKIYKIQDRKER